MVPHGFIARGAPGLGFAVPHLLRVLFCVCRHSGVVSALGFLQISHSRFPLVPSVPPLGMRGGSLSIAGLEQAVIKASGSVQGLLSLCGEHLLASLASALLYHILPAAGFIFFMG